MEVLVARSIRKVRQTSSKKETELRQACDEVLQQIGEVPTDGKGGEGDEASLEEKTPQDSMTGVASADKYYRPLVLATRNSKEKIKVTALDTLQKLIAYGHLRGEMRVQQKNGTEKRLVDVVIESICLCRDDTQDNVQLQVIKALLTAVTSNTCRVRGVSLLGAVRSVYHIYLSSKNSVNRNTAKAALTQMVNIVIQRMEAFDQRKKAGLSPDPVMAVQDAAEDADRQHHQGSSASRDKSESKEEKEGGTESNIVSANSSANCTYDSVKEKLDLPTTVVATGGEDSGTAGQSQPRAISGNPEDAEGFVSVYHRDAFLLFRALCRLSMKGGGDETEEQDADSLSEAVTVSSKVLSLELLLSILNHAGESFRTNHRFLTTIRQYLCVSLLNNCMHSHNTVVSLSLRIFIVLVRSFKNDLLPEIEVFVSNVFSEVLESPNADHEHKILVLRVFHQLCQDTTIVMELFLNYDCISNRGNVFERLVTALGSIAQGRASEEFNASQRTTEEAHAVQSVAMKALSSLMNSITICTDMAHSAAKEFAQNAGVDTEAAIGNTAQSEEAQDVEEQHAESEEGVHGNGESTPDDTTAPERRSSHALATNYDRLKRRRQVLERASLKFRMKPSKGIDYMVEQGLISSKTPENIAAALHELRDDLDKTAIGEYLGEDKELSKDTMRTYVDMMDFTDMRFDEAIRHFLSGFRLPGEAQKIDRMMEKFAERYTNHNPNVFPSADTAFILAYSVIMLQTDAHNPSIKPEKKMTKEAFINNNRGIADGKNLPSEFLGAIYDSIVSKAISLQEDDHKRTKVSSASGNARVRREAFHEEKAEILRAGEEMMLRQRASAKAWRAHQNESGVEDSGAGVDESLYYSFTVITLEHVRALFDVAWGPLLAVFSVNFETNEDPTVTSDCLKGLQQAVHASGHLGMTTERDAFVSTLSKFTLLDQPTRQMRPKNVACVKAIVQLALDEGQYLGEAWGIVLMCLSQIARLQNIGAGGASDGEFFVNINKANSRRSSKSAKSQQERARAEVEAVATEKMNASYVSAAVDEETIIRIFTSSVSLETRVLKEFVGHLCRVSLYELQMANAARELALVPSEQSHESLPTAGASTGTTHQASLRGQWGVIASARKGLPSQISESHSVSSQVFGVSAEPRVFSLQKVVEVADYNMEFRPRVLWAQVWDQLSRFFTAVGCHTNVNIAMFAIDSLKQLSYKFLDQGELKHFPFQTKFLAPFHAIMEAVPKTDPVIRELILQVFANIIRGKASKLYSGWQTLFAVHTAAADDANDDIVSLAFETVHTVVNDHFDQVTANNSFEDLVKCLVAFAGNDAVPHTVSLRAVDHLAALGTSLVRGRVSVGPADENNPWCDLNGPENDDVVDVSSTPPLGADVQFTAAHPQRENEHAASDYEGAMYQQNGSAKEDDATIVSDYSNDGRIWKFTDKEEHLRVWWPLLTGLAGITSDHRLPIRTRALNCLFGLLRRFGPGFSQSLWSLIFSGVLLPLFDDVRHVSSEAGTSKRVPEDQSWLKTTCMAALSSLVRLQARFFNRQTFLLPELLKLLENCINQDIEGLARIGVACLQILLSEAGPRFTREIWSSVIETLRNLFTETLPTDLLEARDTFLGPSTQEEGKVEFDRDEVVETRYGKGRVNKIVGDKFVIRLRWGVLYCFRKEVFPTPKKKSPHPGAGQNGGFHASLPFNSQRVITQCVVQLELISSVGLLAESHLKGLGIDQLEVLLGLLEKSSEFARQFNADRDLRQALWRAGFMRFARQNNKLPSLLRQETSSTSQLLNLLLRLLRTQPAEEAEEATTRKELAVNRLKSLASGVVWRYVKLDNDAEETRAELRSFRQDDGQSQYIDREVFREAAAYAPIVLNLLDGILAFTNEEFDAHLSWLYDLLLDLIKCGNHEVRNVVKKIFDERVRLRLFPPGKNSQ
eukprot:gb/GECG01008236.1/.p1 GENE.gb/GECG01008236.1/~~gb/GECG01008236.1/.p1  ORF type:complete len:1924 (+),score=268.60 gb/GECG01008236.1/:1-5772(+)